MVIDENKNQLIIKIANVNKEVKTVSFELKQKGLPKELNGKKILLKSDLKNENTLDSPFLVKPVESEISVNSTDFNVNLQPESFQVLVFNL